MTPDRLLALYETVVDAPDAIARLRRFVLDLAVRGKLVEQNPTDEPASELLKRIESEKARLVKAGEIKVRKLNARDRGEPIEFCLPTGWVLTELGQVSFKITDGAHKTPTYVEKGIPFVSVKDFSGGRLDLANTRYIPDVEHNVLYQRCDPQRGDILFGRIGTLGKAVLVDTDVEFSLFVSVGMIRFDHYSLVPEFFRLLLNSPFVEEEFNRIKIGGGTHTNKLNLGDLHTVALPLPPLAEQHRIVAKVEELMALLDRLEAARTTRESTRDRLTAASLARLTASEPDAETLRNHARFALDALPALTARADQIKALRQTILNLAVRGKLVKQDPADEPAPELLERLSAAKQRAFAAEDLRHRKPVGRIERSQLHFDFPEGWALPSFDDLFVIVSGVTKGGKFPPDAAVELPYLRVANVQRGHLDLAVIKNIVVKRTDLARYRLKTGDILMTEGGDWDKLGRAAIWRNEIAECIHQNHVFRARPPSEEILPEWVIIYVNSELGRRFFEDASKKTTNLASINMTQLRSCPVPLPPLAEQHRIVAKVDALMALCDQLEAALSSVDTTRQRLLEALLHEALAPASERLEAAE